MGASALANNQALDGLGGSLPGTPTNLLAFVMLNSGATGSSGTNELASTTRQSATWNAAAGAGKTNSNSMTFTTPGTTAATNFGTSSAQTGGTFGIGGPLNSSVTATTITIAAGALNLASASSS